MALKGSVTAQDRREAGGKPRGDGGLGVARVGEGCQLLRRQRTRGGVGPDEKLVRDCVRVCACRRL